jgi:rod shape-determining protein MreD
VRLFDSLIVLFFMALIPALLAPAIFPSLKLTFFAPFLVLVYYKKSYLSSMWIALFCGLIMDIFSSQARFGLYAVNYCVTTWFLFRQKRHFFEDSVSTLPIMTYFFAVISSLVQVLLLSIFVKSMHLTLVWVGTDLIMMPILDAIYAFVWFTLPRISIKSQPET